MSSQNSQTSQQRPLIVSLEGNIGAGKSTLIRFLKTNKFNKQIIFLEEPLDEWNTVKDKESVTALEHFYQDKNKYSFPFQMMAYISRLSMIKRKVETAVPNSIIFMERSLQTDKNVFEKMLYNDGYINDIEHQIYHKWFDEFSDIAKLTHIVYLSTTAEISHTRIQKRNRDGESEISQDYLRKCHDYHNDWIMKFETPTLILDGNTDINSNIHYFKECCQDIMNFLGLKKEQINEAQWLTGC